MGAYGVCDLRHDVITPAGYGGLQRYIPRQLLSLLYLPFRLDRSNILERIRRGWVEWIIFWWDQKVVIDTWALGGEFDPPTTIEFYVVVWLGGGLCTDRAPDTEYYTHERCNACATSGTDPQETLSVPEFAIVALPVVTLLGLVFLFNHRRRRKEQ